MAKTSTGATRKRGAIGPPLKLCERKWCRMPIHEAHTICLNCLGELRQIEQTLIEIRRVFPETSGMSLLEIFKRLWEFRWQRRSER